jgi:hypothetical protein
MLFKTRYCLIGILLCLSLSSFPVLCVPSISLSPETGISTVTVEAIGFTPSTAVIIYWDDQEIPSIPNNLFTDEDGDFTCIISVYTQTEPGLHEVKAIDDEGNIATAIFTVINVKGEKGDQGSTGSDAGIPPGFLAGWLLLAMAIGGLAGGYLGRRKEKPEETT